MFYRDFMQKFRPLYSPDDGSGAAAGAGAVDAGAGGGAAPGAEGAAAAAAPGADAPAAAAAAAAPDAGAAPAAGADAAPAAAEPAKTDSAPSLLEAAAGKPKPDAEANKDPAKDEPAPAAAEKTDAEKAAEAAGDKPKTEAELKAEADAAAATDPDNKDATAEIQPPAPIKYEAFKLPDGVKLGEKELGKFTDIVGTAQVPQDVAQKIVDLYVEDRGQLVQELRAEQRRTWDTLNDTWKTEMRKDPELGGNRLETTLSTAKAVIEEYGGNAEQVSELLAHTSNNGMGNFPGFVRLLHNIGVKLNVFEDGMVPANPQAPKGQKSPGNRGWYDKTPGGNGAASA